MEPATRPEGKRAGDSAWQSPAEAAEIAMRVKASGSSFYWAMRLMDGERRAALFAVYAFCREVDDIADDPDPAADKMAALADWRARVAALCAGTPRAATLDRALAAAAADYGLRRADFEAVIEGMEMDAQGPIRAPDADELDRYCDRVAAAVGRLCVRVFGAPEAAGRELADRLGRALQLTNIIRDVEEDTQIGRLYLPEYALREAGIAAREPRAVCADPALAQAKAALARWAEREFDGAKAALARCETGDLRPAIIMMRVYERIFARLKARGFAPVSRAYPARLRDKLEKLAVAAVCAVKERGWRDST